MSNNKITRTLMVALLALSGTLSLAGCGSDEVVTPPKTVDKCIAAIEAGDKNRADKACAIETGVPATVGIAADLQLLMKDLGGLISLVATQINNAPAFAPAAELNVGSIAKSALNKIMKRLRTIEKRAMGARAESWEDLSVKLAKVELALNIADLIPSDKAGDIPADLRIDLAGEWNRLEVVGLGVVASGVLALLDALLAHQIKLDLDTIKDIDLDNLTTSSIAGFVVANPNLLTMDSTAKLKEASTELQTMLDLLAGKAGAGDGNEGLLAVLDEQLIKDADQSDNLVEIIDNGTKGKFDKGDIFVVKAIEKTVNELKLTDPPKNPGQLENKYISRASLDDATDLGRAVHANLAGSSSTPISLKDYLGNAWIDLKGYTGNGNIEDPAAWLAISPKKFFETAKPIRAYIPGIYAVNVSEGSTAGKYTDFSGNILADSSGAATDIVDTPRAITWEFAFECELAYDAATYAITTSTGEKGKLDGDSGWRTFCGAGSKTGTLASKAIAFGVTSDSDTGHFAYQVVAGSPAAAVVTDVTFVWAEGLDPVAAFDADGQYPLGVSPESADGLPVIGLQDPSIGGMLLVDPTGAGNFADADNLNFNATLAVIYNTYIDDIDQGVKKIKDDMNKMAP